jgi:hypothetical protein
MPIHDWTRVDSGIFHHFHGMWIAELCKALNAGGLPPDYYALIDQVTGRANPDVLTLSHPNPSSGNGPPPAPTSGGVAVGSTLPRVRFRQQAAADPLARRQKAVVVRHVSADRVVAMIEVVSPGNKGSRAELESFVDKAVALLRVGVGLLILDLFPPGPRDSQGIHGAVWAELQGGGFELPDGKPLTLAAYSAGDVIEAFVEPVAVGDSLPDMPLFLTPDTYVPVSLAPTYQSAWAEVPRRWQQVLDPPAG